MPTVRVAAAAVQGQVAEGGEGDYFKSRGLVRHREQRDLEAFFRIAQVNQATHSVRKMCRVLQDSRSGFYAWPGRPMRQRRRFNLVLTGKSATTRSPSTRQGRQDMRP